MAFGLPIKKKWKKDIALNESLHYSLPIPQKRAGEQNQTKQSTMKTFLLETTWTASFWARLPANAQEIKARWEGQKMEVSWREEGIAKRGFVSPQVTQTPRQLSNLLSL